MVVGNRNHVMTFQPFSDERWTWGGCGMMCIKAIIPWNPWSKSPQNANNQCFMADITKSYPFCVLKKGIAKWSHFCSLTISSLITLNFLQPQVTSVTSFFLCNNMDDTVRPKETKQKQPIKKHIHQCLSRNLETNNIPLFAGFYIPGGVPDFLHQH